MARAAERNYRLLFENNPNAMCGAAFLEKPFSGNDLAQRVRETLDGAGAAPLVG